MKSYGRLSAVLGSCLLAGSLVAFQASADIAVVDGGIYEGNDCVNKEIGNNPFADCKVNGSPIIAKFEPGEDPDTQYNTTVWTTLGGSEISVTVNANGTWDWTYTPGAGDPLLSWIIVKASSHFQAFAVTGNSGTVSPVTYNGQTQDISHLSFYDTADPNAQVPLPAAAWLLLSGMIGLFGIGRRRAS